jgi:hypothetical protein
MRRWSPEDPAWLKYGDLVPLTELAEILPHDRHYGIRRYPDPATLRAFVGGLTEHPFEHPCFRAAMVLLAAAAMRTREPALIHLPTKLRYKEIAEHLRRLTITGRLPRYGKTDYDALVAWWPSWIEDGLPVEFWCDVGLAVNGEPDSWPSLETDDAYRYTIALLASSAKFVPTGPGIWYYTEHTPA